MHNGDDDEDDLVHQYLGVPNEDEPGIIPRYTGGFTHAHNTYTFTAPNHETAAAVHHDLVQLARYGHGYAVNQMNIYFTCNGLYNEGWIVPLIFTPYLVTERPGGWCVGCGFYLVEPHQPFNDVSFYYTIPESGCPNYANYFHYACAKSHFSKYNLIRYQASLCLYYPHVLEWALSSNQLHHKNQDSFTYVELIDLFVGLKLSGYLDQQNTRKKWKRIRQFCFILRLNGKTEEQMRRKYRHFVKDDRYARYFTHAFHQTIILPGVADIPIYVLF
jgi:hypothetical protein